MKLSIVMSSRNEVEMLSVTVRSVLEDCKFLSCDYEVVICDNSDQAMFNNAKSSIPEEYIKSGLVNFIHQKFPCLFTARETAAKAAKGEYILMLDSHMLIGHRMIADMVDFMDSQSGNKLLGFAHAPITWSHRPESKARHDRDISENDLGPWGRYYDQARKITWKGIPWICRRSWFLGQFAGQFGPYGSLARHKMSWGGGDFYLGTKSWMLGFENWAIPTSPGIHIGPFKGAVKDYRTYQSSGQTAPCVGFLTACYILGDEPLMTRNRDVLKERFGPHGFHPDQHWSEAKQLGEQERRWMRKNQTMSYADMLNNRPWDAKDTSQFFSNAEVSLSFIFVYQYSPDRDKIFQACLTQLLNEITDWAGIEICVLETGISQSLTRLTALPNIKYQFVQTSVPFDRAWSFNYAVRTLSTGDKLVMMDADILINSEWLRKIRNCPSPSVGWSEMIYLTEHRTKMYLSSGHLEVAKPLKTRRPSAGRAAGGLTVLDRETFFYIRGFPEFFSGSWGGPDNALWYKLQAFGFTPAILDSTVHHLFHRPSVPCIDRIRFRVRDMKNWTREEWEASNIMWGDIIDKVPAEPEITVVMVSWLRFQGLLETLKTLSNCPVPLNLSLALQGTERLSLEQREEVKIVCEGFCGHNIVWSTGNRGSVPKRREVADIALRKFSANYLLYTDDDVDIPHLGIISLLSSIKSLSDYGALSLSHTNQKVILKLDQDNHVKYSELFLNGHIEDADLCGAASLIVPRKVHELCNFDPGYFVGFGDFDFCLQIRAAGWKLGILKLPHCIVKNRGGGSAEYRSSRCNTDIISKSEELFTSKWGIDVKQLRQPNRKVKLAGISNTLIKKTAVAKSQANDWHSRIQREKLREVIK